jgi:uncharacterized protein YbjQ (UPF0145 family)
VSRFAEALGSVVAAPSATREHGAGTTSDLTIDEVLLLHSEGWEPVGVAFGISWWSIPWGVWQWGQVGEVAEAAAAFRSAFDQAASNLRKECSDLSGVGVVGVDIELRVHSNHIDVALTGTAIRRTAARRSRFEFISDLSARDFVLLSRAGWVPIDLVASASFVIAPRRSARQWAAQQGRNTELTNLTQALYHAREMAMEGMQQAGLRSNAQGIVDVKLREGPLGHSARIIQFVAVGTAVRIGPEGHRAISPTMVMSLDEKVRQFEAASLRSSGPNGKSRGVRRSR